MVDGEGERWGNHAVADDDRLHMFIIMKSWLLATGCYYWRDQAHERLSDDDVGDQGGGKNCCSRYCFNTCYEFIIILISWSAIVSFDC